MPSFSDSSLNKLSTCAEPLQRLFKEVVRHWDCTILEGHRSLERQKDLVAEGRSMTMKSRHLSTPSGAVDVAPYPVDWRDLKRFRDFGNFVKGAAAVMKIQIEWGGDWRTFKDYPHFQLRKSR